MLHNLSATVASLPVPAIVAVAVLAYLCIGFGAQSLAAAFALRDPKPRKWTFPASPPMSRDREIFHAESAGRVNAWMRSRRSLAK